MNQDNDNDSPDFSSEGLPDLEEDTPGGIPPLYKSKEEKESAASASTLRPRRSVEERKKPASTKILFLFFLVAVAYFGYLFLFGGDDKSAGQEEVVYTTDVGEDDAKPRADTRESDTSTVTTSESDAKITQVQDNNTSVALPSQWGGQDDNTAVNQSTPVLNDKLLALEESFNEYTKEANVRFEWLIREVQKIQQYLQTLSQQPNTQAGQQSISVLQQEIRQMKQILTNNQWIDESELVKFKKRLDKLEKQPKTASISAGSVEAAGQAKPAKPAVVRLPFDIASVDLWNGRAYVAVMLHDKVSLLATGDVVMGWKVRQIDFKSEVVEFVNTRGQIVKKQVLR